MKDTEIRGLLLQKYYEIRRQDYSLPSPEAFGGDLSKEDILYVSDQLGQHGLIEWKPLKADVGGLVGGMGRITAYGIDVVENTATAPIAIQFSQPNINISGSNVAIGDSNTQTLNIQFDKIVQAIDHSSASDAEKKEAKSLLTKFLEHPLVKKLLALWK